MDFPLWWTECVTTASPKFPSVTLHTAQDNTTNNKCVKEGWERQKIERCAVLRGRTGDVMAVTGVVSGLSPVLGIGEHSQWLIAMSMCKQSCSSKRVDWVTHHDTPQLPQ